MTPIIKTLFVTSLIAAGSVFARNNSDNTKSSGSELEMFQKNFQKILKSHDNMIAQVIFFSDHIGDTYKNANKIQSKKKKLESFIDDELTRLKSFDDIKDSKFLDSVSYYYNCIKKTIEKEYNDAISLRSDMKYTHPHVNAFVGELADADNDIIQIEKALYEIEKQYASMHGMVYPKEMEELKSNIFKNEEVLRYHNRLLLTFHALYEKENELLQDHKSISDSVIHAQRIAFADLMLNSIDTVFKYRDYNGDQSFTVAIKQYFKYIRARHFEEFDFYNEYVSGLRNRQTDTTSHMISSVDKAKYTKEIRLAQSQLNETHKTKTIERNKIIENIEVTSFVFLYKHSPRFKK